MNLFFSRSLMILLLALSHLGAFAGENLIQLSPDHIDNLGIKLGKLEAVSQFQLLSAPAKVTIPPAQEYIVSATQSGFIEKLTAAVGDKVAKGQVLAQLNSPDLLMQQQQYLKAENALRLASTVYRRDKKLLAEGVIPDRRWQETDSQYQVAASELDSQKQLLGIAGMTAGEIEQLGKSHRFTRQLNVRAPIAGVVIERSAVIGTHIDMMAPIYRVANLDRLWLDLAIPQERIADIKIGDRVIIENSDASASIILLGQKVDSENQTILARAEVAPKDTALLRAGQRLNTRIIQAGNQQSFKIPNAAIAQHEGKFFIFIRNQQGFAVAPVAIIGKQDNETIISGDLTGNEQIAVDGSVALKANWLGLGSDE